MSRGSLEDEMKTNSQSLKMTIGCGDLELRQSCFT